MHRLVALLSAVAAFCVLPAVAADSTGRGQAGVQAHLDASAGIFQFDFMDGSLTVLQAAGRANLPLSGEWNLQIDAQALSVANQEMISATDGAVFVHLYQRIPDQYAWGAFGGIDRFDVDFFGLTQATVGVEAQRYFDHLTLYGQGWYSHLTTADDAGDVFGARAAATVYFDANTAISGDLAAAHLTASAGDFEASIYTAIARATHRFEGTSIAPFAEARWDHIVAMGDQWSTTSVMAGVRVLLDPDGSTLQSNERSGPPMSVLPFQYLVLIGGGG
jgi:hypothetical protein